MKVDVYPPSDYRSEWLVTCDGTGYAGCANNNDVQDLVRDDAPVQAEWDSESGQFFAYLNSKEDAKLLAQHIEKILSK